MPQADVSVKPAELFCFTIRSAVLSVNRRQTAGMHCVRKGLFCLWRACKVLLFRRWMQIILSAVPCFMPSSFRTFMAEHFFAGVGGRQIVDAQLTAEDLQLDSFLPGSRYPVICSVQPTRWVPGRLPSHAPRLQLALEVRINMRTFVSVCRSIADYLPSMLSIHEYHARMCSSPLCTEPAQILLLGLKFPALDALLYAVQTKSLN